MCFLLLLSTDQGEREKKKRAAFKGQLLSGLARSVKRLVHFAAQVPPVFLSPCFRSLLQFLSLSLLFSCFRRVGLWPVYRRFARFGLRFSLRLRLRRAWRQRDLAPVGRSPGSTHPAVSLTTRRKVDRRAPPGSPTTEQLGGECERVCAMRRACR